jgi:predicted site-specific integrase-resolvase
MITARLNHGVNATLKEGMAKDIREMITVFSSPLYGSRPARVRNLPMA